MTVALVTDQSRARYAPYKMHFYQRIDLALQNEVAAALAGVSFQSGFCVVSNLRWDINFMDNTLNKGGKTEQIITDATLHKQRNSTEVQFPTVSTTLVLSGGRRY